MKKTRWPQCGHYHWAGVGLLCLDCSRKGVEQEAAIKSVKPSDSERRVKRHVKVKTRSEEAERRRERARKHKIKHGKFVVVHEGKFKAHAPQVFSLKAEIWGDFKYAKTYTTEAYAGMAVRNCGKGVIMERKATENETIRRHEMKESIK